MIKTKRIRQVIRYGWKHAGEISSTHFDGKKRIPVFLDILFCHLRFGLWSNQYLDGQFWSLSKANRNEVGQKYGKNNEKREKWLKDFYETRSFLSKYSSIRYERENLRDKRNKAYAKRFNAGNNLLVEYDVNISRQHYLEGTISIGDNVLIAKHVFIDYSGRLVIKDNVQLTNGVIIETHRHPFHSNPTLPRDLVEPTDLVIEEGAVIGSRAIILPSCHYIGKNARIGAGSVVTKDVADNILVAGVPASFIKNLPS